MHISHGKPSNKHEPRFEDKAWFVKATPLHCGCCVVGRFPREKGLSFLTDLMFSSKTEWKAQEFPRAPAPHTHSRPHRLRPKPQGPLEKEHVSIHLKDHRVFPRPSWGPTASPCAWWLRVRSERLKTFLQTVLERAPPGSEPGRPRRRWFSSDPSPAAVPERQARPTSSGAARS